MLTSCRSGTYFWHCPESTQNPKSDRDDMLIEKACECRYPWKGDTRLNHKIFVLLPLGMGQTKRRFFVQLSACPTQYQLNTLNCLMVLKNAEKYRVATSHFSPLTIHYLPLTQAAYSMVKTKHSHYFFQER